MNPTDPDNFYKNKSKIKIQFAQLKQQNCGDIQRERYGILQISLSQLLVFLGSMAKYLKLLKQDALTTFTSSLILKWNGKISCEINAKVAQSIRHQDMDLALKIIRTKVPARFIRYDNLSSYKLEQNQLQSLNKLIIVLSDGDVLDFDKFKQTIDALDDISELQMKINISDSDEVHEVFQYLLNTAFPKFKNTVQQIAFEMFQIKTKSANLTQKYLLQFLQGFNNLDIIQFELKIYSKRSQELQTLYDFLSIIDKKNGSNVCFKQLDIKIELDKNNQKLVEELLKLPNQLGVLTNLEGISIDFNNLGLDQQYFQALFKAIQKMSKLKKLCMNISKNRLTVNNTLSFIQQIAKISCNIQSLAYIDSQMINAQCMDKFVQGMKRFKNLKELYLQGISFSQHTGGKFFSIFSCLPQLEKLNLDLFDCKINQEDMGFLVKNIQTLTNLDSLYLVFPTQKQYSEKKSICQAIVQIFQRFENQLKSLQLEVNERFYSEESNLIAEAICQLRKLKFLQIIYGGNYIQVTDNNQDSIWDQMQPQISYTSRENIFLCILYNKIMLNQNSEMSSLSIEYTDNYQFKQEDYQKFTKMKSLTFNLVGYQINHILIMKIIQGIQLKSSNYLKSLSIKSQIMEFKKIIEISQCCKELYFLSFKIYKLQSKLLKQLFQEQPYLQQLIIYENTNLFMFMEEDQKEDPYVFLEANYLTEFQHIRYNYVISNKYIHLKYTQILQYVAYQKLVQPQLVYKPMQSHFDLIFD